REARAEAGAHRHVGDVVQELPDDGQDDARERRRAGGARQVREDQVPGGGSRPIAREAGDAEVRRRWSANLRHPEAKIMTVVAGRSKIATTLGIVAASQPLAARAGVQILERGGTASDAAIAANAVLGVVEPEMNGIGGAAPRAGERFANPSLAQSLRTIAADGAPAFYAGPIAGAIVDALRAHGGTMTASDLAEFRAEWVAPVSTTYHGWQVFELPPN